MSLHLPPRPASLLALSGFLWFVLMGMSVTMTGPISSLMSSGLGQPSSNESQIGVALFTGSAIIVGLNGFFSHWFTGRWVARYCAVAFIAGATVIWTAQSWTQLLLGYGLIGLGNGGNSFWYNAEIARVFRDRGVGAWLSALNGFWAVGAMTGPLLVGQSGGAWRWPVQVIWALGLACLVFAWIVPAPPPKEAQEEAREALPRKTYGLMVLLGLYVGVEITTLTFMSRHLMQVHEMTLATVSAIASSLWFAFMIARFGSGAIALRVHPSRIVAGAAVLAVVGAFLTSHPGLGWIGYVMIGVAMGPVFPSVIQWGTSMGHAPHRSTAIMVLGPCFTGVAFPALVSAGMATRYEQLPWIVLAVHACIAVGALALGTSRAEPAS
ncbi:MAG: MFS transporter [Chthonomonas sp.]|nr:MFS transporter [Chthonomonas sp.]